MTQNTITITFYPNLLGKVIERMNDKSSKVREASMELIWEIIEIHLTFYDPEQKQKGFTPLSVVTDLVKKFEDQVKIFAQ